MKAVRLHEFNQSPVVDDVPEPQISGPLDVIVKIGGAGVCRTDLHITLGQWDERMHTPLPYILGHENAGWVHEVGSGVTNVAGRHRDPAPPGHLRPVPRLPGGRRHALRERRVPGAVARRGHGRVPAHVGPGLRQAEPLDPPQDVAALADAGITAYHAVRKALPLLYPAPPPW